MGAGMVRYCFETLYATDVDTGIDDTLTQGTRRRCLPELQQVVKTGSR